MSDFTLDAENDKSGLGLTVGGVSTPEELIRKIIAMPAPTKEEIDEEYMQIPVEARELVHLAVDALRKHLSTCFGSGDESLPNKLESHGRSVVRGAVKSSKSRGNLPGHLQQIIDEYLRPPAVSWTELLQMLIQRAHMTKRVRGMQRVSKPRAAMQLHLKRSSDADTAAQAARLSLFPGASRDPRFTVYFALDTSGSMGIEDLQAALSELRHVQKSSPDMQIYVLYVDTHVCTEYLLRANDDIDWTMVGRGGTDFEPAFAHIKEMLKTGRPADLLIYATDGYAPPPETKLTIQTVWLLTAAGQQVMREAGHTTLWMKSYTQEELEKR